MKQLAEFIPIIIFFVIYQMDGSTISFMDWSHTVDGIYSATKALLVATFFILPLQWWLTGYLEKRLLWTSAAVFVFGGATLFFKNELFIQWKPTVFNWGMAIAFAVSQFWGDKNLIERLMGSQIQIPRAIWQRICWVWVAYFSMVGALNLFVAYQFSEATWVSYKMWSFIPLTFFIMVITAIIMSPSLKADDTSNTTGGS
ncbi:septation protein IspZ [Luminiphilus sp.]|jgi:intracellular septation protein|nr:septation protein IspZ [Halieaceae bacterium]MDA7840360.1 septation protein IspZ [Luminiphilus sp.]MDA8827683.1 septation protein IspZ [Luminiphilus sp.]MDB2351660.1 septation protein IspZ [Luminiphilus sp.]